VRVFLPVRAGSHLFLLHRGHPGLCAISPAAGSY
jgi:hypothetical protein